MYKTLVSTAQLSTHLHHPDWTIVDCRFSLADTERGRRDYVNQHIPGAVYAHLDEDLSGAIIPGETGRHPLPEPQHLKERFSAWGIDAGVQVVAYDDFHSGIAARLWWLLRWMGHDAVAVLDGGWPGWMQGEYPTSTVMERPEAGRFDGGPEWDMVATTAEVERIRLRPDYRLVDSRAVERYLGEVEPIDPVAGCIPGATNLPWPDNTDATGQFLPPAQLKNRFEEVADAVPDHQVIFYCGSGVTAANNILAMVHAGLPEPKLYAGSWSQWITDRSRPMSVAGKCE